MFSVMRLLKVENISSIEDYLLFKFVLFNPLEARNQHHSDKVHELVNPEKVQLVPVLA